VELSVFPTLDALTVFVCCFRPLVRRAGPQTNVWFAGWIVLLIHYFVLMLPPMTGAAELSLDLLTIWSVNVCALCFLWAAGESHKSPFSRIFVCEIAVPLLLQSTFFVLAEKNHGLQLISSLLLLVPAIHLLVYPQNRTSVFTHLSVAFALLSIALASLTRIDAQLLTGITTGAVFLSTAYLIFTSAKRFTRGIGLMTSGLVLWGVSSPLQSLDPLLPAGTIGRALLDFPRYLLAAGMVLSFLDDYVGQTERLALHDPLTGLPNRRLFENRLDAAIEESRITQTPVACLVIDVDGFKNINDTLGHPVGDGLLQALAKRLSWNLGPRDLLARTGGDEFSAVLVEAADEYHVRFIAGAMLAAGCVPVSIKEHSINVRISIGIAVSPQDALDSNGLHKAADDAMYQAKRRGGSILAFAGEEIPQIHAV
jgi:diguanylate cyclase (GGDEF)-like protein